MADRKGAGYIERAQDLITMNHTFIHHEAKPKHEVQFLEQGYSRKYVFAHRAWQIPKPAPDATRLARWMLGEHRNVEHWTMTLHAAGASLDGLPPELFFDNDLVVHRQQYGEPGHIAFASLAIVGEEMYVLQMVSDTVQRRQRAGRYCEHLRNRFRGWRYLLVNAIVDMALARKIVRVHFPRADYVTRFAGVRKPASDAFFTRLYDDTPATHFQLSAGSDWWCLDTQLNRLRVVTLPAMRETRRRARTICILHDIERGIGHRAVDARFSREVDRAAPGWLEEMLAIEREVGCETTYCVVGSILPEVRGGIEHDGHCLAFHSYDHRPQTRPLWQRLPLSHLRIHLLSRLRGYPPATQLKLCRDVDYLLRGYRPPNSIMSRELTPDNLCYFNFDWLASSSDSLGIREPRFQHGIAYLPIHFDDFPLYRGDCCYADWETRALAAIESAEYIAFGLHDCYADHWLPHYRQFLERVQSLGEVRTLEAVANDVCLAQCR